ncbi:NADP-dependent alcohol dehydrogenase 6 [Psilocybe cubensis]|uniref:NADP-dependent alcohol dehydrogenase 6 n=1 Tax=Psilocybe cubensis TaxID=181762 RepID=A0ACB8GPP8_PSICU|nr:NADP-dependent alcohol dehydrogenase 6 [Psilocybe cubensis]KAH9477382.1 NADP-dependent alcohol dehydrogenase 6 [Psilocybe cubensis]
MAANVTFKGYAIEDTSKSYDFKLIEYQPKPLGDFDVDIKIAFCGVCGTDIHTITGGWGTPLLPVVPGHEIAGHVVSVGPQVKTIKVGDRVGVGCSDVVYTYNCKYPECGTIAKGGYANGIRVNERFVFPIPDGLKLEEAAPMFCGGLTVYSPLVRNGAGHFALQFAKALECDEVIAFSHSRRKEDDAKKLGATKFVATGETGFEIPYKRTLDIIIVTTDVVSGIALDELMSTLVPGGRLIMVAIPDDKLPAMSKGTLFSSGLYGGSVLGSKKEAVEMLQLACDKGIKPWIDVIPMSEAAKAVQGVKNGLPRYRYVLKQDIDQ